MTPTNREELAFRVVGTGSTVELSTKRDQGGETKVELRVSGDEIERLYGQRQK